MSLFESLMDWDNGYGATFLVKYFSDYDIPMDMGYACRAKTQPGFILDAMNKALQLVEQSGDDSWLVDRFLTFGKFRYQFYDQDDEPIRLWEEALSRVSASADLRRRWTPQKTTYYTNITAQVYFDIAVQNHNCKCMSVFSKGVHVTEAPNSERRDQ